MPLYILTTFTLENGQLLLNTSGNDKAKLAPNQLILTDTNGTSAQMSVISNFLYSDTALQSKGFSVADSSNSQKGAFFLTGTGKSKLDSDIITATETISATGDISTSGDIRASGDISTSTGHVIADTVNVNTLKINNISYVPTAITINGTSYTIPVSVI